MYNIKVYVKRPDQFVKYNLIVSIVIKTSSKHLITESDTNMIHENIRVVCTTVPSYNATEISRLTR